MTNTLLKLTTLTLCTLALTACGGGGGSTSGSTTPNTTTPPPTTTGGTTTPPPAPPTANLLANCTLTPDKGFASAQTLVAGTTLHKVQANTRVNVWDLNNGTKKACTSFGSVEIL